MQSDNTWNKDFEVIIIGGGLAGLISSILLRRAGKKALVIEKRSYPHHRVCGEYISNEVLPLLASIGFDPFNYGAMPIDRLRISTPSGKNVYTALDLGGFGLSRYAMDHALYKLALQNQAIILTNTKVTDVVYKDNLFTVKTNTGATFTSGLVIGSYGKRDALDKQLNRRFIQTHSPYLGVKYHIKTDYPINEVGLDNFEGGYCGISRVENGIYNLCYLYHRPQKAEFKSIPELEANVLYRNPVLKNIFSNSEFMFHKPEVINEISFASKSPVENHILMCGDSAGLITPLCGNGMAMAMKSAMLLCDLIIKRIPGNGPITSDQRTHLERTYWQLWQSNFSTRLFWGRTIQKLFGRSLITQVSINSIHALPGLERWLISKTHGEEVMPV